MLDRTYMAAATSTLPDNAADKAIALCLPGDVLLGGGCEFAGMGAWLLWSKPMLEVQQSWECAGLNKTGSERLLWARALCYNTP